MRYSYCGDVFGLYGLLDGSSGAAPHVAAANSVLNLASQLPGSLVQSTGRVYGSLEGDLMVHCDFDGDVCAIVSPKDSFKQFDNVFEMVTEHPIDDSVLASVRENKNLYDTPTSVAHQVSVYATGGMSQGQLKQIMLGADKPGLQLFSYRRGARPNSNKIEPVFSVNRYLCGEFFDNVIDTLQRFKAGGLIQAHVSNSATHNEYRLGCDGGVPALMRYSLEESVDVKVSVPESVKPFANNVVATFAAEYVSHYDHDPSLVSDSVDGAGSALLAVSRFSHNDVSGYVLASLISVGSAVIQRHRDLAEGNIGAVSFQDKLMSVMTRSQAVDYASMTLGSLFGVHGDEGDVDLVAPKKLSRILRLYLINSLSHRDA